MAEIIENGTIASVVRKSMENRAQLPNKGDIYIGTGNKIDGSDIPDTIGQNIITAINENASDKVIRASVFRGSSAITSGGNITAENNITSKNGVMTAQSFNATSDKRLKENIEKYSPKQSVLDLPVYSYNFIKDTNKTQHIGCLAQDLQKICPEIVHEGDNGFLSIEENKLVYLLLEEVKKLKKRVDELEVRNGD